MENKTANTLYIIGKVLLGLNILMLLCSAMNSIVGIFSDSSGYFITGFYIFSCWIPLVLLVVAFFLVKKHPIVVGRIFIIFGLFSSFMVLIFGGDVELIFKLLGLFLCLSFLLIGYLFLQSGLIQRHNRVNQVANNQ